MNSSGITRYVALVAVLLILLAPAANAGEIHGKVTDYADGKPLDGVRVSVSDGKNTKGPIPTLKGGYKFGNRSAGQTGAAAERTIC
jgi:hypothetical protein